MKIKYAYFSSFLHAGRKAPTLQAKFIVFIVLIHGVAVGLSFLIFRDNKLIFLAAEALILFSLFLCGSLYNDLVQPLRRLRTGLDAIRDRDFNVKFQPTGKAETDALIEVYNEMIDLLRRERTQQEAQHRFLEKLIFTAPTGILIMDFDDRIADFNPKAAQIIGLAYQKPLDALLHLINLQTDNLLLNFIAALPAGETQTVSLGGGKTFRCSKAHFIDRGFPRRFVMIQELTAEIAAAEKKAYSKVIRLMAHEVNNSVGAVNSILDTVIQLNEASASANVALQIAFDRNQRMNQFMRNYAEVVRLPEPRSETIHLVHLIHKTTQLLLFNARQKSVIFQFDLPDPNQTIYADPGLMEQALINIVKNAIESIEQSGVIIFRTCSNPPSLIVEDNGKGVPQNIEDKLFTPFFTTKPQGQGVGLMVVREILTAHGFQFSLKTLVDPRLPEHKRTIFKIEFSARHLF